MLVVLIIMSLSAAFVVPQLAGSLTKMNAGTAASKIAASLRHARSKAAAEGVPYRAEFNVNENRLTVRPYPQNGENTGQTVGNSAVYDLPDGVRLKMRSDDSRPVIGDHVYTMVFFPSGASSGGRIMILDEEERSFTLSADLITGSVKVTE
ncbi:MAG: Tfp pilus assembly protein FimT/FimU [Desulfococcaceae bacterium]